MKKLINDPSRVVPEMLEGLVAVAPGLALIAEGNVVVRADAGAARDRQVALISGGGAGHEPAHAGYVGSGMLSAAVAGDVFTSPAPDAVLTAIRAVTGRPGCLLIVKNYTGDRLNFGLAAELARAEGFRVATVVVGEDVAITEDGGTAGRRGLAGTVLVHKIAGAAAAAGADLESVAAEARAALDGLGTMGVALSPCTVPAAGEPGFSLGDDEVELGLGIHGEPGMRRAPIRPADALADELLATILDDRKIGRGDRVALLVNNLGGTPPMELAIVARRATALLDERGVAVTRAYVGTFLSALEMAGCSLSLLRLDDVRLARLDSATEAPAWPNVNLKAARLVPGARRVEAPRPATDAAGDDAAEPLRAPALRPAVEAAARALIDAERRLTELDRAVGDGDLGISLARGARAVLDDLDRINPARPAASGRRLAAVLQRVLGGTSGPLYAVFLLRAAERLARGGDARAAWAEALRAGCRGIADLGGAERGDRTMLDALLPAADALKAGLDAGAAPQAALGAAAEAAEAGAKATGDLTARRGRSSYLGERVRGHPDPGAVAVGVWLRAAAGAMDGPGT